VAQSSKSLPNALKMCKLISSLFYLAGNDYSDGSATHHHAAPNGTSGADARQAHNFYPTYPSQMVNSGIPSNDDMHLRGQAPHQVATRSDAKEDEERRNVALFGDLPEAKRRKFIRKNNSVYPRSWFATEMQSPPPSPRRGRWPDDVDVDAETTARTLVPVPMTDGSETKLPVPRMNRVKRSKEVTLNDLGYRMSWSQSRVFSGRTLFLQRSLDAYRNKMRSTMVAAGRDVTAVAPHFETRVGKRKWLERSKKSKRDSSPS